VSTISTGERGSSSTHRWQQLSSQEAWLSADVIITITIIITIITIIITVATLSCLGHKCQA
jgi:hypothetical protein